MANAYLGSDGPAEDPEEESVIDTASIKEICESEGIEPGGLYRDVEVMPEPKEEPKEETKEESEEDLITAAWLMCEEASAAMQEEDYDPKWRDTYAAAREQLDKLIH